MLTEQDKVVIRIALENMIEHYDKLLKEHPSKVTDGAFKMAKAITEGTLEHFNQVEG